MKDKIMNLLNDKVDEVFVEMQEELKIEDGNIFPLDALELESRMEQLAEIIESVLISQK